MMKLDGVDTEVPQYKSCTLRSRVSALKKFWTLVFHKDLDKVCPLIEEKLKSWAGEDLPTKKARTFEEEELLQIYRLPNTTEILPYKAYIVCDIAFAGRGIEGYNLKKGSIIPLINSKDGKRYYEIRYIRVKKPGQPPEILSAFVIGVLEVGILDEYMVCMKGIPDDRNLFQKLNPKTRKPAQNIGIHSLKECGKRVARAIGES
jgi:hypothetical protein